MKSKTLLTLLLALLMTGVSAQNSRIAYFMNLPESNILNPAFKPACSVYVGLPAISGMNFNIANNFFNFSDVFMKGVKLSNESISFLNPGFNVAGFLARVKDRNFIETQASIQLLGVGLAIGSNNYFFLDIKDRITENVVLPGDLIRFAFLGAQQFAGKTLDLSDLRADARYFHEIGAGFSRNFTPKLRIGARAKLLFGVASVSGTSNIMKLKVNNDLTTTLQSDAVLHNNGAIEFKFDNEGRISDGELLIGTLDKGRDVVNYLTNTGNAGLGLDLGADYEINNKFDVSAAITDLGFINWKADPRTSDVKLKSEIVFHGFDFTRIYDGTITIDSLAKTFSDTLTNVVLRDNPNRFRTPLPTTFTLAGRFTLNEIFSFGIISASRVVDQQFREALTFSGNVTLWNILNAGLTYTIANRSYNNIGAGFSVRAGYAQFYFLVDRIPLTWSRAGDNNNEVSLPANWNTINTWFMILLIRFVLVAMIIYLLFRSFVRYFAEEEDTHRYRENEQRNEEKKKGVSKEIGEFVDYEEVDD
jgi:hypothetical protein